MANPTVVLWIKKPLDAAQVAPAYLQLHPLQVQLNNAAQKKTSPEYKTLQEQINFLLQKQKEQVRDNETCRNERQQLQEKIMALARKIESLESPPTTPLYGSI